MQTSLKTFNIAAAKVLQEGANKFSRNKWSDHSEGKHAIKSTEQKKNEAIKEKEIYIFFSPKVEMTQHCFEANQLLGAFSRELKEISLWQDLKMHLSLL